MNEMSARLKLLVIAPSDIVSPVFIAALGVYLSLAGAAGNPIDCNAGSCRLSWYKICVTGVLAVIAVLYNGVPAKTTVKIIGWCTLYFLVPVLHFSVSDYPLLLLSKVYGGWLGSLFGSYFIASMLYKYGEDKLALGLMKVIFLVLIVTVIYKIPRGIFDRQVYLFNGPIVFGWLMSIGFLASSYIFLMKRNSFALIYIIIFGVGVFLSFSRGPMLALVVSLSVMLSVDKRISLFRSTKLLVAIMLGLASIVFIFKDVFLASRLSVYRDVVLRGSNFSGEMLLGSRSLIYDEGFSAMIGNFLFGIGGANFPDYSRFFGYPHNVHFEVLLEYGIFVFLAHLVFVGWLIYKSSGFIRALIVFFFISLSLSGDLAYMRYVLAFGIPIVVLTDTFEGKRTRRARGVD